MDGAGRPPQQAELAALSGALNAQRANLRAAQLSVGGVVRNLLKEPAAREATLAWFGELATLNRVRTKTGWQVGRSVDR